MLGEEGNSVPHPFESHIHVQEAGNPTQIAPWGSPDWTSFHQWPHIHPTKWSHCSFSSNTLAICKQPVILSPSTHGNPASKSQFPCFKALSVFRPPLFGFRFWQLHSEELSCKSLLLLECPFLGRHPVSPALVEAEWVGSLCLFSGWDWQNWH